MRIKVFTLFPDMLRAMLGESILGRAIAAGLLDVELIDIRDYTTNKHRNTDDYPFGGGAGMVMMAQPIVDAMAAHVGAGARRIYLSPRGRTLTQRVVEELAGEEELALLCGHYEGVDQRALDLCIDEELSIGDYVLTGGELGALVVIDAVARLIPGVLGSGESSGDESFSQGEGPAAGLLEYPQYTRPADFRGLRVPESLLGGDHAEIVKWRRAAALDVTRKRRPDLLENAALTDVDRAYLRALEARDTLTAALDAAGIQWTQMDPVTSADFERAWLEAFVPREAIKRARRMCLDRKGSLGGLEQAFLRGLIPAGEGDAPNPSGAGTAFLPAHRIGVSVADVGALAGLAYDGLLLTDAALEETALCMKGKRFGARRVSEG